MIEIRNQTSDCVTYLPDMSPAPLVKVPEPPSFGRGWCRRRRRIGAWIRRQKSEVRRQTALRAKLPARHRHSERQRRISVRIANGRNVVKYKSAGRSRWAVSPESFEPILSPIGQLLPEEGACVTGLASCII